RRARPSRVGTRLHLADRRLLVGRSAAMESGAVHACRNGRPREGLRRRVSNGRRTTCAMSRDGRRTEPSNGRLHRTRRGTRTTGLREDARRRPSRGVGRRRAVDRTQPPDLAVTALVEEAAIIGGVFVFRFIRRVSLLLGLAVAASGAIAANAAWQG